MWAQGVLAGKYAGVFVSTAGQGGGQGEINFLDHGVRRCDTRYELELLVMMMISTLAHHGINFVPLGYKHAVKQITNVDEVHGGE